MVKKVSTIFKKFSFWEKIRMFLAGIGMSSEVTLFLVESYPKWKVVAAIATISTIAITYIFKDNNGNDIVDLFEKP